MEKKKEFIKTKLEPLLKECVVGVVSIAYERIVRDGTCYGEWARIFMEGGYTFKVNIHMDSNWAIVKDVIKGIAKEFNI